MSSLKCFDGDGPLFIGLGHYRRTGKDSFANYLLAMLQGHGIKVVKRSFAWKLKDVCHQLYGWAGVQDADYYEQVEHEAEREIVLPKLGMSPRDLWIKFGTPAVREQVYRRTWLDWLLQASTEDVVIVPDVRFPNEFEGIREKGGTLIKVVRPGYGPGPDVADQGLVGRTDWDTVIGGAGTMLSLQQYANDYAAWIRGIDDKPCQTPETKAWHLAVEKE